MIHAPWPFGQLDIPFGYWISLLGFEAHLGPLNLATWRNKKKFTYNVEILKINMGKGGTVSVVQTRRVKIQFSWGVGGLATISKLMWRTFLFLNMSNPIGFTCEGLLPVSQIKDVGLHANKTFTKVDSFSSPYFKIHYWTGRFSLCYIKGLIA